MPEQMSVHHAAQQLIERYGRDAARQARLRADELAAAGDAEGHRLWRDICDAVAEMLRMPQPPKTVN